MNKVFRVTITPKFDVKEIIDTTIKKDWLEFQESAKRLGARLHRDMRGFIKTHRKRDGGTNNLANSINFVYEHPAGFGYIFWGIGDLDILQKKAKYWYVVNYGKMITGELFRPGNGKLVGGMFGTSSPPFAELRGKGTQKFTASTVGGYVMKPGIIRPMHYIEYTQAKMDKQFYKLLEGFRKRK